MPTAQSGMRWVALVHHHDVEELGRDARVVGHGRRLPDQGAAAPRERRPFLQLGVELGLALEDAVEALDRGDDDLVHRVDRVLRQVHYVVGLGELPPC